MDSEHSVFGLSAKAMIIPALQASVFLPTHFKVGVHAELGTIRYVGDNFNQWFVDPDYIIDTTHKHPNTVIVRSLDMRTNDQGIIAEAGNGDVAKIALGLPDLFSLMEGSWIGKLPHSLHPDYRHVLYVPDRLGVVRAVMVHRYDGWRIDAHDIGYVYADIYHQCDRVYYRLSTQAA